jgi:predicted TIM-barrel fold metal-dependent hydrolase
VRLTRREVLRAIAVAPVSAAAAACSSRYPRPLIPSGAGRRGAVEAILMPFRARSRSSAVAVIDVHAHFFNASDVPVRGFISECLGHNVPLIVRPLIREMAVLAEKLANRAPTAFEELNALTALVNETQGRSTREVQIRVDDWFRRERAVAAERVVDVVRGSGFERRYREMVPSLERGGSRISVQEVLDVASEARQPAAPDRNRFGQDERANAARSKLEFLTYMLSARAANLRTYIDALSHDDGSFGVDAVFGCLVDFDYWLDRPPRSAHDDQIALHDYLASLHGGFMKPVVAYNPWTDIAQNGAGLKRVLRAWETGRFVAVKIYPPIGFMPANNAIVPVKTRKRRPDLKRLDAVLTSFFTTCAGAEIPIIAHTAHSNGRDDAHDEFSSPTAWAALLQRVAADAKTPVINLGHFGGDSPATLWTRRFAELMHEYPQVRMFGDIGYWDQLMCGDGPECEPARNRLKDALAERISTAETVADRVMFGTDWLMSSQIPGWRTYPTQVHAALRDISSDDVVAAILGRNALKCFSRLVSESPATAESLAPLFNSSLRGRQLMLVDQADLQGSLPSRP